MSELDRRYYEVWRAFVLAVREKINPLSGLTKEVSEQLLDAAQPKTSGYEILEALDWVERRVRREAQDGE